MPNTETRTLHLTRVGDFYEAYGDDAETLARELEIALSRARRGVVRPHLMIECRMAGVPYHALDRYVQRLAERGYAVLIAGEAALDGDIRDMALAVIAADDIDTAEARALKRRFVERMVAGQVEAEDADG